MPTSLAWRFHHSIRRGDAYIASYTESSPSNTTVQIGNLYEKNLSTGEETKCYYANGQRMAMRKRGTLYHILSDPLGSSNVVVDTNDSQVSRVDDRPYGRVSRRLDAWPIGRFLPDTWRCRNLTLCEMGVRDDDRFVRSLIGETARGPRGVRSCQFSAVRTVSHTVLIGFSDELVPRC